jgi:hypothetical protein
VPVAGPVDGKARLTQARFHSVANQVVVFYEKYAHGLRFRSVFKMYCGGGAALQQSQDRRLAAM